MRHVSFSHEELRETGTGHLNVTPQYIPSKYARQYTPGWRETMWCTQNTTGTLNITNLNTKTANIARALEGNE